MCITIYQNFCQGGHLFPFCPPTTSPVISACLSFSVNCCFYPTLQYFHLWYCLLDSYSNVAEDSPYSTKPSPPPFQHRKSLQIVHFEGMDSACTHLPWSSTNETNGWHFAYFCIITKYFFLLLHMITVFCFTFSHFLLHVCTCGRMTRNTVILLPEQDYEHFIFLKWHQNLLLCYHYHFQHNFWYLYFLN